MVYFVIAGIFDCEDYIHVCHVVDYLREKLPNIEVQKLAFDKMDWGSWLQMTNIQNNWHHLHSPLIYKELKGFGTQPHLVGGISEFWEYCWDYYGLESVLSKEDLENLKKDYLKFNENQILTDDATPPFRNVLMYGPKTRFLWLLLAQLFEIEGLPKSMGLIIKFYNDDPRNFEEREQEFDDVIAFLQTEYNTAAKYEESLADAVNGCELMIITEHFSKDHEKGLLSQVVAMNRLGDIVNHSELKYLKVIFANYGLACYPATILASRLNTPNVVVVTSDLGLGPLSVIARVLEIDIDKLSGPPVWGFIGNNKIIDLGHAIKKCNVYKPHDRAGRVQGNSSLEQGTISTELRFINYLIDDAPDIWLQIRRTKDAMKGKLQRAAIYSKLSATVNLLKLWFAPIPSDEIISLGVLSDGSYKIPVGMVFSQPAILEKGMWVPFPDYPISPEISKRIDGAVKDGIRLLNR